MGDLISRQAAIDAFDGVKVDEKTEYGIGYNDGIDFAVSKLSVLPSAQQWIPVTERLPKNMLYVLVTYKHEHGPIDYGIARYSETEHKWYTSRKVIAWMPLPAPYLERGQNG